MEEFKPDKKNFWHYKEIPQDPEVAKLMPEFKLEYIITEDTVPNNTTTVWNHSIFPAGAQHHKHKHTEADEVAYVVRGQCIAGVTIDGKDVEQVCGPGTTIWASKGQVHWHKNPFDEHCEFVGVYCGCGSREKSGYVDLRTDEENQE